MAFSALPTDVISSWAVTGEEGSEVVSFPVADVTQLDAGEADAASGDSRRILFALLEQYYDWYVGLATDDKPSKMTLSKSSTLQTDGTFRNTYTASFYCEVTDQEVLDEV